MNEYLYEVRGTKVRNGKVILVPYSDLHLYTGFRSVYGYGEEAIKHIKDTGSTAGLISAPVYSDLLLVDFDDQPEAAHAMAESLKEYDFVKFDSGGRSIHLHVRITPMVGPDVPSIQKEWVRKYYPLADLSIYRTSGMYRMAGTYHEKNAGRFKKVIDTNFTGKSLYIDKVEIPAPKYIDRERLSDEERELQLMFLLSKEIKQGTTGRNLHVFKISKVCMELGMNINEAVDLVASWNNERCYPSLSPSSIIPTVKSAYREVIHYG